MKEQYIAPFLDVACFAPVERLADNGDPLNVDLLADGNTSGGAAPSVSAADEDFDLDIP